MCAKWVVDLFTVAFTSYHKKAKILRPSRNIPFTRYLKLLLLACAICLPPLPWTEEEDFTADCVFPVTNTEVVKKVYQRIGTFDMTCLHAALQPAELKQ